MIFFYYLSSYVIILFYFIFCLKLTNHIISGVIVTGVFSLTPPTK